MKNFIALCLILVNIQLFGQDQMSSKQPFKNSDENNNTSPSWFMGAAMLNVFMIGDLAANNSTNGKSDFVDNCCDIFITPTPVSQELSIYVNAETRGRKINVAIFSLKESKTVFKKVTRKQNVNLDMLALSKGEYLIKLSDTSNKTLMLKQVCKN